MLRFLHVLLFIKMALPKRRYTLTPAGMTHILNKMHYCTHYRTRSLRAGACESSVVVEDHHGKFISSGTGRGATLEAAEQNALRAALGLIVRWI